MDTELNRFKKIMKDTNILSEDDKSEIKKAEMLIKNTVKDGNKFMDGAEKFIQLVNALDEDNDNVEITDFIDKTQELARRIDENMGDIQDIVRDLSDIY